MKKIFGALLVAASLSAISAFASEPQTLYYYNSQSGSEKMSVEVLSDGSANIVRPCGHTFIASGWNVDGKPMLGESSSGPISTFRSSVTVTATESRTNPDLLRMKFSGQGRVPAVILEKSDKLETFMICL